MSVLIWLIAFAIGGFSPVDTIPGLTPNRILPSKSNCEEQIVIVKTTEINLPASRLPNRYYDSYTFTRDISLQKGIQKGTSHNGDLTFTLDQTRSQSNRLLFQERQECSLPCGQATVSPYDTYCCEEGEYCTTVSGNPQCNWSTSAAFQPFFQPFSTTPSTPTNVVSISPTQTTESSSATEEPSSSSEELPTTSSTLTTTMATPTTSAISTLVSTGQSSSTSSETQTSITEPSRSSSGSVSSPASSSTNPTAASGGAESNSIALGVGIGVGVPGAIAGIICAWYAFKVYHRKDLKTSS